MWNMKYDVNSIQLMSVTLPKYGHLYLTKQPVPQLKLKPSNVF